MIFYLLRFADDVYKFGVTSKPLSVRYAGERRGYIIVAQWQIPTKAAGRHIEHVLKDSFRYSAYRGPQLLARTGTSEMLHLPDTKAPKVIRLIEDLVCDAVLQ